jgi:serine/threonine protein kinase
MGVMFIDSVAAFIETLRDTRLLDPEQMEELKMRLRGQFREPNALAKELIRRDWLTPYQVNQLYQGRGCDLVLGSYVLLERLGKGGMGLVYKARHRRLDRIVALKLIRKELLSNPTALRYFHREILAAAQLAHPNIVLAYDADAVDGVNFLTMEYVEGHTFSELIQASGPLPVEIATESIRQAALGLQHAFERGLVHRDLKPSNLMLSWTNVPLSPPPSRAEQEQTKASWGGNTPLVKILDMGLARLNTGEQDPVSRPPTTPVKASVLMGTPDFMAPEQAEDAQRADTRSDIYSLGCTFFYVLTAQVPFSGGSRIDKLLRHRTDAAPAPSVLRRDVPPAVDAVVRKMMAKRPEDRYQQPHELAKALAGVLGKT